MKKVLGCAATAILLAAPVSVAYADAGCHIETVQPNSPADKAGLKPKETIIAANGLTIRSHEDLIKAVNAATPDLKLIVQRGEKTDEVSATLEPSGGSGQRLGVQCRYDGEYGHVSTGPQSLSIGGGLAIPTVKLDTGFIGAGEQPIGQTGFIMGAQYLREVKPWWELGVEGNYSSLRKNSFAMAPFNADLWMRSTVLMVITKIHPPRTSRLTPYGLFGMGVHVSQLEWEVRPMPGFVWSGGSPQDARSLFSDSKTGFATTLGGGLDYDFPRGYFFSFEGRLDVLSKQTYNANDLGNALGIQEAEAGGVNGVLLVRLGIRFGLSEILPKDSSAAPSPGLVPITPVSPSTPAAPSKPPATDSVM